MVEIVPVPVGPRWAVGISVQLPRTHLQILSTPAGYIMCGALDVALLDRVLGARRIVAGRALGVRTLDDLLREPLESVTDAAWALGLRPGMPGKDALELLLDAGAEPDGRAQVTLPTAADGQDRSVDK